MKKYEVQKTVSKSIINTKQIRALLWRDLLVRMRQPWITLLQYAWLLFLFMAICFFRLQFVNEIVEDCQFPTRPLPIKHQTITFFQSYICTAEDECLNATEYEETSNFENAPLTPLLHLMQTFVNEPILMEAIVNLPHDRDIMGAVAKIFSHEKFKDLQKISIGIVDKMSMLAEMMGIDFDMADLWSGHSFVTVGEILCGRPFTMTTGKTGWIYNIFSRDDDSVNRDEIDSMPTPYCKKLFVEAAGTAEGKMFWGFVKPFIQGKIVYGPSNPLTDEIMSRATGMYEDIKKVQQFVGALNQLVILLRTDTEFQSIVLSFFETARSPFVQMLISGSIDIDSVEEFVKLLLLDDRLAKAIQMIVNFFECFSTDRLVRVTTEAEMERRVHELFERKMFHSCVHFHNVSRVTDLEYSYTIRMDLDFVPPTAINWNPLYFPEPNPKYDKGVKYQRGFVQLQYSVDQAIIETIRHHETLRVNDEQAKLLAVQVTNLKEEYLRRLKSIGTSLKPDDSTEIIVAAENTTTALPALASESEAKSNDNLTTTIETNERIGPHFNDDLRTFKLDGSTAEDTTTTLPALASEINTDPSDNLTTIIQTSEGTRSHFNDDGGGASIHDESERTIRRRRTASDLFAFDFDLLLGPKPQELHAHQFEISTKQFPHPSYRSDEFIIGIYLVQIIQFAFLLSLTIQICVSVWQRIWTKESGNSTLMRVMGLRKSSELLAFIITNVVELLLMFALGVAMMYIAEIIIVTDLAFLVFFLILFAICLTSYYYMVSTFFTNAAIGIGLTLALIYFLFIPFIVLVSHDTELTLLSKFLANLSFVSAFCSVWRQILLHEMLQKNLSFNNVFSGAISENDLKLSLLMLIFDTVLYSVVGYLNERFSRSDFKFYKVPVKYMDASIGGFMRNVTKTFDGKTPVVNNVSITFRRDHVTCLLGHNGAGKTTIIKLLTGQLKQTSGEIYLPHNLNGMEYKETIGLCPQNNVFIPNLTAKELLELYASIKAPDRYSAVLEETIKSLDFGKHLHFKCENLSGGFKRRLNIAIAFIGSPNLVILDEPCAGVDDTGRKEIWRLIADLRKGRAVVLATHYLDEAERLGNNVLFLKDGEISSVDTSATMKHQLTKSFDIQIQLDPKANCRETIDEIESNLEAHAPNFSVSHPSDDDYHINIPYCDSDNKHIDFGPLIESIEKLHQLGAIQNFRVTSKDLSEVFRRQFTKAELQTIPENDKLTNGHESDKPLPPRTWDQYNFAKQLLWKRFTHFKRNYRLIALILTAPVIFEALAFSSMTYRMPSEYDSDVVFSHQLYANSTQFYTHENVNKFNNKSLAHLKCHDRCEYFNSSKDAFDWLLETHDEFIDRRYGGITLNDSKMVVWHSSKGYHAMPVYLNELSSALFKAEMDNDLYKITTSCHPLKFERKDLNLVPMLQELADFGLSIVLVIVFSFAATASCVYVVNERVRGEKLQQRLCNVRAVTYWGVAFLWDFSLYLITLLISVGVINLYDIPVFTTRDNLYGVALLIFMFGFAMIPVVHLTEKLFYDVSLTSMYLMCLNIVIAFAPIVTIVLFDVIGESETSRTIRNFVKRVLLVFPQHALTDGLIELAKNHVSTGTFNRFDVYKYNSPITGTLLLTHTLSFLFVGVFCLILNYLVENGHMHRFIQRIRRCRVKLDDKYEDLLGEKRTSDFVFPYSPQKNAANVFLTAVANDPTTNEDKFDVRTRGNILVVEKLCKSYGSHRVLNNVSFNVAGSECFGLLGVNGAGKSTIFSILSGDNYQSSGSFQLLQKKGISYCPQTNALDDFLTVEEVIHFYARLRKIANVEHLTTNTLKSFHLEQYRNVLVKDLSGGNRRKLSVAIACFGDTQLVLLDEPTSDMDPITRTLVYKAIASLIAARRSVILTSHTISEIEQLCHRIGVMRAGKMISIDSPLALKRRFGQSYVVKVYYDPVEATTIERYVRVSLPGVEHLTVHNECLQFSIKVRTGQCDNSTDANAEGRILLSDLFGKLYNFTVERKVAYTISECLLDQIIQQVHEADDGISHSYSNPAFEVDETQFM